MRAPVALVMLCSVDQPQTNRLLVLIELLGCSLRAGLLREGAEVKGSVVHVWWGVVHAARSVSMDTPVRLIASVYMRACLMQQRV